MDKIKFTFGKFSFPVFFSTNCTYCYIDNTDVVENDYKDIYALK
jgi:hypothetical protein